MTDINYARFVKEGMDIACCLDGTNARAVWYTGVVTRVYGGRVDIKRDDGTRGTGRDFGWWTSIHKYNPKTVSFSRNKIANLRKKLRDTTNANDML